MVLADPLLRCRDSLRFFRLALPQVRVEPGFRDQGGMCAAFYDAAGVEDDDLVSIGDGAEAVGDDERGAAARGGFERVFALRARCRSRVMTWLRRG